MRIVAATNTKKNRYNRLLAEEKLYDMLEEMGNTKTMIDNFQKKRIKQTLLMVVIGFFMGLFLSKWCYPLVIILPIFFYRSKYNHVVNMYYAFKFERHLSFIKFMRLLIPYLKESAGGTSLYQILRKILKRTGNPVDVNSIAKFMSELTDKPNDIQPFTDFAERSSGTDMSVLFMQTIYDFQQNSYDTNVIDELGKIASAELQRAINEIVAFKLRRFAFFPTKIVMSAFLIVIGYAASILVYNLSTISLG
ncbi:lipoprotein, putative (plasmid) [Bacillus thuringiensis MC28]|nr:lipoprotein, putative [Bacillus thuringiensis MC28]